MKTKAELLVDVYNGKISIDELKHSKDYAEIYFTSPSVFDIADEKRKRDSSVPVYQSCIFITGRQAGIGKSCFCECLAKALTKNEIHISSDPAVPFDHYDDQDVVVWHDFRAGDISTIGGLPKFLNLINPQKLNTYTNVKHSSVKLKNRFWIFDSISPTEKIIEYSCSIKDAESRVWELQEEPASQMYRRIIPIDIEYLPEYDYLTISIKKANRQANQFEVKYQINLKFHFDPTLKVDPSVYKLYKRLADYLNKYWLQSKQEFDYERLNKDKPKIKFKEQDIEFNEIEQFEAKPKYYFDASKIKLNTQEPTAEIEISDEELQDIWNDINQIK